MPAPRRPVHSEPSPTGHLGLGVLVAISAGIHLAVIREHLQESVLFGLFFAIVAIAQLGLAGRVVSRPMTRRLAVAILVGNAGLVAVWAFSRTTGLPVGPAPGLPEAVLPSDALATAVEIAAMFAAALIVLQADVSSRHRVRVRTGKFSWTRGAALVAVTIAGIAFTSLTERPGDHDHHAGHAMEIFPAETSPGPGPGTIR